MNRKWTTLGLTLPLLLIAGSAHAQVKLPFNIPFVAKRALLKRTAAAEAAPRVKTRADLFCGKDVRTQECTTARAKCVSTKPKDLGTAELKDECIGGFWRLSDVLCDESLKTKPGFQSPCLTFVCGGNANAVLAMNAVGVDGSSPALSRVAVAQGGAAGDLSVFSSCGGASLSPCLQNRSGSDESAASQEGDAVHLYGKTRVIDGKKVTVTSSYKTNEQGQVTEYYDFDIQTEETNAGSSADAGESKEEFVFDSPRVISIDPGEDTPQVENPANPVGDYQLKDENGNPIQDQEGDSITVTNDHDTDADGVPDFQESQNGTDPNKVDSDGDGEADAEDDYPRDYDNNPDNGVTAKPQEGSGEAGDSSEASYCPPDDVIKGGCSSSSAVPAQFRFVFQSQEDVERKIQLGQGGSKGQPAGTDTTDAGKGTDRPASSPCGGTAYSSADLRGTLADPIQGKAPCMEGFGTPSASSSSRDINSCTGGVRSTRHAPQKPDLGRAPRVIIKGNVDPAREGPSFTPGTDKGPTPKPAPTQKGRGFKP